MNKLNTIDLFAGCGGLVEGFEKTQKYNTLAAIEWEKAPSENLLRRLKDKWGYKNAEEIVLRFDIQRTEELFKGWQDDEYGSSEGLDKLVSKHGKVDLIIGGPPCQAYSKACRVSDENGKKNVYRNDLFESYLEVVRRYTPKIFVFENVPGLLSARPGNGKINIIETIKKQFEDSGYHIIEDLNKALIDFTEYGVPQNRKRLIIVGLNKKHFGKNRCEALLNKFYECILPSYKEEKMTVQEAIGDLPKLYPVKEDIKINRTRTSYSLPEPWVENHVSRWHSERDKKIFKLLTKDIEEEEFKYESVESLKQLYYKVTGRKSNVHKYYVIRWDKQSNLIPAHLYKDGLRHIHPDSEQSRTITVREAARLQTFPDDYIFYGSNTNTYKMIGNAVPPKFAGKLALALYKFYNQYLEGGK